MSPTPRSKKAAQMVLSVLDDLNQSQMCPEGVSERKLTDLLSKEYEMPQTYKKDIVTALNRGVEFGAIEKKNRKYTIGAVFPGIRQFRRRRSTKSRSKRRRSKSRKSKRSRRRRRAV